MEWKKVIIDDLKRYAMIKSANEGLELRIRKIDNDLYDTKSINYSSTPSSNDTSKQEDKIVELITLKGKLETQMKNNQNYIDLVEKYLSVLNETEKKIIYKFYISRPKNHIDELIKELNYEQSQIYKIKDTALKKIVLSNYGLSEC